MNTHPADADLTPARWHWYVCAACALLFGAANVLMLAAGASPERLCAVAALTASANVLALCLTICLDRVRPD